MPPVQPAERFTVAAPGGLDQARIIARGPDRDFGHDRTLPQRERDVNGAPHRPPPSASTARPTLLPFAVTRSSGRPLAGSALVVYPSRSAEVIGRRAARIAGSNPPRIPITRANAKPTARMAGVILKAKAISLKLWVWPVPVEKPFMG